ncbi:hypothetical protein FB567DRAFT_235604 [Paraphoma chrysanthemicola]|uniref:Uncharacterized protein n=1 Tax=Paraphoma chrysanthemicola TaxID=798071 RepID=A0A8K0W2A0_9PLEO|nr:hypothetical protein FB567DRAFT_235604 [Paraphoma chrysanthemicola]
MMVARMQWSGSLASQALANPFSVLTSSKGLKPVDSKFSTTSAATWAILLTDAHDFFFTGLPDRREAERSCNIRVRQLRIA